MGDDRRNDGTGAVVVIVVILGILGLLGALVVFGGAFLFLASHSDVQVVAPQITSTPTASVAPASDQDAVPAELEPEPEGVGASVVDLSNQLEVDADGNFLLGRLQLPIEDLKPRLAKMKESDESLKVKVKVSNSEAAKELLDILKQLDIPFEVQ